MRRVATLLSVLAVFSLSACTYYLPMASQSSSVLAPQLPPEKYQILGSAEGSACASYILGFPTAGSNLMQTAVNQAVRSKNGDLFVTTTSDMRFNYFPAIFFSIYQEQCVTLQGFVLKLK
ncbi:MAG: hypothetical protein ABIP82_05255 [Nitrospirales bacterium]